MSLLRVKGLVKTYGSRKVVNDVSFRLDKGEIIGLLGPNGAGKTTTFKMTVGLISPDGGSAYLVDKEITHLPMYKRARLGMGYLSQEPSVFQQMTVQENIEAILEAGGYLGKKTGVSLKQKALELLGELGLVRLAGHRANTLSGGERRRLEITRTLATNPELILLDEPFSGVDPIAVEEIQNILFDLRERGIGILITDHAVGEMLSTCDRSYIINEGRIFRHGSAESLASDPEVRRIYLGSSFELPKKARKKEPQKSGG